jgi:hypothetical protein
LSSPLPPLPGYVALCEICPHTARRALCEFIHTCGARTYVAGVRNKHTHATSIPLFHIVSACPLPQGHYPPPAQRPRTGISQPGHPAPESTRGRLLRWCSAVLHVESAVQALVPGRLVAKPAAPPPPHRPGPDLIELFQDKLF